MIMVDVVDYQRFESIPTQDLICRAMRLINAVGAGETPDIPDLMDALQTLNEMLADWNLQPLATYRTPSESWVLTPGQYEYDWGINAGPTGFTSSRPISIANVVCTRNGFTTAVDIISQRQYDDISLKSITQPLVERVLYVNDYPNGKLFCFPVPSEAVTLTFDTNHQLEGPATLNSMLSFPPGYLRGIRYNLAVELWPEYTNLQTDIESIKQIARDSLGKIKSANQQDIPATFGDVPGVEIGRSWDWRAS